MFSPESASSSESAFGMDLNQLSYAVNFSSKKSLLIMDEFGKGRPVWPPLLRYNARDRVGTSTTDGTALFGALIKYVSSQVSGPKVLLGSHETYLSYGVTAS